MKMQGSFRPGRWRAASASLFAGLLLLLGGTATAQTSGILTTKHNLGANGPGNKVGAGDTTEVCVFCHTPHGAAVAPAPLWNKRLGVNGAPAGGGAGYTTYQSMNLPSLDGTVAPVGGVSMACLSCHDGTQAMDNIINAPGSGNYDPAGGANDGRAYTWSGTTVDGSGKMIDPAGGVNVALLGRDLSNDHPIGIQYCGGGLGADGSITGCKDQDFKPASTATINSNAVFWLDTGNAGSKQRTDLPLYPGRDNVTGPLVECATCHDPHVSAGQTGPVQGVVAGETFLRISNANSAVCTACHVK